MVFNNLKKRRLLLVLAIGILIVFSNQLIYYQVSGWWEGELEKSESLQQYEGIILLGGFSNYRSKSRRIQFTRSSDRLLQAVRLYKEGKANRFIFTGGSSRIIIREKSSGEFLKEYLVLLGIPEDSILTEWQARNTYENAVETWKLLKAEGISDKKFLLVTSGFHMKRALGCFKKVGIDVTPFKTDALQGNVPPEIWECFMPSASVLATWELLFKEWVGYAVYSVKGYV
ncbi:YdcF family protein [Saccharicrinis sp. GN24d3]|uniref:YdcF family protein n=1 Tax=Saccharicrinis sp. GN24d3 TaxID=3458416 RepID=UPI0040369D69